MTMTMTMGTVIDATNRFPKRSAEIYSLFGGDPGTRSHVAPVTVTIRPEDRPLAVQHFDEDETFALAIRLATAFDTEGLEFPAGVEVTFKHSRPRSNSPHARIYELPIALATAALIEPDLFGTHVSHFFAQGAVAPHAGITSPVARNVPLLASMGQILGSVPVIARTGGLRLTAGDGACRDCFTPQRQPSELADALGALRVQKPGQSALAAGAPAPISLSEVLARANHPTRNQHSNRVSHGPATVTPITARLPIPPMPPA